MKIATKLWIVITGLVLIIMASLWLFQVVLLNEFYINERISLLEREGNKIRSSLKMSSYGIEVTEDLEEYLQNLDPSIKVQMGIIDYKNDMLIVGVSKGSPKYKGFDPMHSKYSLDLFLQDEEIKDRILKGEKLVKVKHYSKINKDFITVLMPLYIDNENIGSILLTSPIESIQEMISILKKQLSFITVVLVPLAGLLALAVAKKSTMPILKMIEASKEISKGNFDILIEVNSTDEIATLGNSMNEMSVKLAQIENLRKEFIANVSHELKTPISLIRAYSELITDIDNNDDKNEYATVIIDESKRLNTMVEDILYLSQIESGCYKLNKSEVYVLNLLKNVCEKLEFFASKKNIDININYFDENVRIYADEDKLYQVFYNIINNAIIYSYEDRDIEISILSDEDDYIRVHIKDNGIGIPKEEIPYIWDRFYKSDKSRKRNNSGTGLGMSIVKNLLVLHGFEYGVESEVSKGTLIWIKAKIYS